MVRNIAHMVTLLLVSTSEIVTQRYRSSVKFHCVHTPAINVADNGMMLLAIQM
jgi:hypothetical protein